MALSTPLIIVILLLLAILFLLSICLRKIIITQNFIFLEKIIGRECINLKNVTKAELPAFCNLTSTIGIKGLFRYNGFLMDDSNTLVNDRRKMVKIYKSNKNYIIGCDDPVRLKAEFIRRR